MKVGDQVKVVGNSNNHGFDINEIIRIKESLGSDGFGCGEWLVMFDDVEPIKQPFKNTPKRYATDSIDVIDFCKLYNLNFNLGNVVKYTCRNKGTDIEDYKKAIDYLQREIKHLENL
jgi:hypothetical protein